MIRINKRFPYYATTPIIDNVVRQTGDNLYIDGNIKMRLVNEQNFMIVNKWFLLPQAYSLKLAKI